MTDLALIDGRVERGEDVEPDTRIHARERVAILAAKVDALRHGADVEELEEQRLRWRDQREVLDDSRRAAHDEFRLRVCEVQDAVAALLAAGRAFDDVRAARRSLGPEPGAGPEPIGPKRPAITDPDGIVAAAIRGGMVQAGQGQSLLAREVEAMAESVGSLRWIMADASTDPGPMSMHGLLSEPVARPVAVGTVQHGGVRDVLAAVGR